MALLPSFLAGSAEADFAAAEAIFSDFFGRAYPPEFHDFMFWPWEAEILRQYAAGELARAEAIAAWRRGSATALLMHWCAEALGVRIVQGPGGYRVERRAA